MRPWLLSRGQQLTPGHGQGQQCGALLTLGTGAIGAGPDQFRSLMTGWFDGTR
jgi:hypothetical protein